jgi:DNA repair exonuclease SbcCD ATPase subunit
MGDLAAEREAARQELAQLRPLRERLVRQRQGIDSLHRYLWGELTRRDTQVGERDEIIRRLQAELHAKVGECNRVIHDLQARLETQASPVGDPERPDGDPAAGLDPEIGELERELHDLQAQLDGIQRARLWSVVTGYWALRQKLRRFVRRK